jgi:hypothetical protein
MKLQYRYSDYTGFKWIIELYHDGELVKSYTVYLDELEDEEQNLVADGYTYGYTKEEVAEAKKKYEEMLSNIIQ